MSTVIKGLHSFAYFAVFMLSLIVVIGPGPARGDTFYIDPSYEGAIRNGTEAYPYKYWTEAGALSGTDIWLDGGHTYLQKAGTTAENVYCIVPRSDVLIGAYGVGDRPIIHVTAAGIRAFRIENVTNVTVQDVKMKGSYAPDDFAKAGILLKGSNAGTGNHVVQRCEIEGFDVGIDAVGLPLGFTVYGSEIHHQYTEGILVNNIANVEIAYNHIHDVNQAWFTSQDQSVSDGDGIQFMWGGENAYIHHNLIDHSSTGNKFCFIIEANGIVEAVENVRVEYNHMIGSSTTDSGAVIYWHHNVNGYLRHNIIEHSYYGLYNDNLEDGLIVYDNLFLDLAYVMRVCANQSFRFYNNTVVNSNGIQILWGTSTTPSDDSRNNIFCLNQADSRAYHGNGTPLSILTSDYNCFYPEHAGMIYWNGTYDTLSEWQAVGKDTSSTASDPLFVDPDNKDFRLQSGSPCKAAGTVISGITAAAPVDMGCDYTTLMDVGISDLEGVYLRPRGSNISNGLSLSEMVRNGSATMEGGLLQLTPPQQYQRGSAYVQEPVDVTAFSSTFRFQVGEGSSSPADGLAFLIQNQGITALGGNGGGMGFSGISDCVAIWFEFWGSPSTGVTINGVATGGSLDAEFDFNDGDIYLVEVDYDGVELTVAITDTSTSLCDIRTYEVDIPAAVGDTTAYAGFSAGTGSQFARQTVLDWTYEPYRVQIDYSTGFAGADLFLNGIADVDGVNLCLTPSATMQRGSAYHSSPVNVTSFETAFEFQVLEGSSNPADGMTFVIQNEGPQALGDSGNGLGYRGITSSVAVRFEFYGAPSTGLLVNGTGTTIALPSELDFDSGDVYRIYISYDGVELTVEILNTVTLDSDVQIYAVDIPSVVGDTSAYVGFTGATGGQYAKQKILWWYVE